MIPMWKELQGFARAAVLGCAVVAAGGAAPVCAMVAIEDFCRPSAGRTIVFVDVTTRFAEGDDRILFAGVESIVRRAQPGSRLSFMTITDSFSRMDMPFDLCIPACSPADGTCAPLQAKRVVPDFNDQLQRAMTAVIPKKSLPASDIALTLSYALRTRPSGEPVALFLFSDMLERSRVLDLQALARRASQKPDRAAALRREGLAQLKKVGFDVDLSGVKITIFGFGREDGDRSPLDPEAVEFVRQFWTEAFGSVKASAVEFHGRLP